MREILILVAIIVGMDAAGEDLTWIMSARTPKDLQRLTARLGRQAIVKGACELQRKSRRLPLACENQQEFEHRCEDIDLENVELAELLKAREIKGLSSVCRKRLAALYKIRRYQAQEATLGPTFERLISHDDRQIFASSYRIGRAHRPRR